jgi:hypothetical protein
VVGRPASVAFHPEVGNMTLSADPAWLLACYGLGLGVKGTVDAANIGRAFAFARPAGSGSCVTRLAHRSDEPQRTLGPEAHRRLLSIARPAAWRRYIRGRVPLVTAVVAGLEDAAWFCFNVDFGWPNWQVPVWPGICQFLTNGRRPRLARTGLCCTGRPKKGA